MRLRLFGLLSCLPHPLLQAVLPPVLRMSRRSDYRICSFLSLPPNTCHSAIGYDSLRPFFPQDSLFELGGIIAPP